MIHGQMSNDSNGGSLLLKAFDRYSLVSLPERRQELLVHKIHILFGRRLCRFFIQLCKTSVTISNKKPLDVDWLRIRERRNDLWAWTHPRSDYFYTIVDGGVGKLGGRFLSGCGYSFGAVRAEAPAAITDWSISLDADILEVGREHLI